MYFRFMFLLYLMYFVFLSFCQKTFQLRQVSLGFADHAPALRLTSAARLRSIENFQLLILNFQFSGTIKFVYLCRRNQIIPLKNIWYR